MGDRLRFRSQVEIADCGAACLAMVLDYHGKRLPMEKVRAVTGSGRDGVSAMALIEAAKWFGLDARGVKVDLDDLDALPRGSLLFWNLSHFVVLDRVGRRSVRIIDPSVGRRTLPLRDVSDAFTGIAIVLQPGASFERGDEVRPASVARYLKPILRERATLGSAIAASALLRVVALALPLVTAIVVDRVVPRRDRGLLDVLAVTFAAVVVFNFLGSWTRSRLFVELRTKVDYVTTMRFVEHLAALPYSFHLRRSAGDLINRLRSNAAVREVFTTSAISAFLDGTFALAYLGLLLTVAPPIALIALGLGAGQAAVLMVARRTAQRLTTTGLQAEARSQSYGLQMLAGMGTLKASGTEARAVERFGEVFRDELGASMARARYLTVLESTTGMLRSAAPLVLLTIAAMQVVDGHLTLGTALAVNALAAGFLAPVDALISNVQNVVFLRSYLERLNDVFDAPREQDAASVRPAPRLGGAVRAERVSFRYDVLAADVVRDVSVDVPAGSFVAVVGRSGSGKTTLAHVLLGLYPPTSGRVLHDGIDLAELEVRSVRSQLGVVTQDPYLFSESIRDNIAFANPDMPFDDVVEAARLAAVLDDVQAMPMGFDTLVGEAGALLSGGQRQRVAIARAIAARPRLMLLDEATSHLDAITEQQVYASLEEIKCTRVVVAHRLSTIVGADLILVVDDGRIVERGTHDELVAAGGTYASLVARQMPAPVARIVTQPRAIGSGGRDLRASVLGAISAMYGRNRGQKRRSPTLPM